MRPLTTVLTSAAILSLVSVGDAGTPEPVVIWAACLSCKAPIAEASKPSSITAFMR